MHQIGEVAETLRKRLGAAHTSQSSDESCRSCRGTGWVRIELQGPDGAGKQGGVRQCDCLKQRIAAAQLRAVPERFRPCTFENYVPADSRQDAALVKILGNPGRGLYLWGHYGRGKTHLAAAQYKSLASAGQSCAWRASKELVSELLAAEIRDETSIVLQRARYAESFHLFVDDLDKLKPTDWKGEALHEMFDLLYRRNLSLTVTSNLSLREIGKKFDGAIVRRLDELCVAVEV